MRIIRPLLLLLCLASAARAARPDSADYYDSGFLRFENHVYRPHIKTVRLHNTGVELSSAIIGLNSDDRLQLSFDDFNGGVEDYRYTFVHCDAGWKPSDLIIPQYISGFQEDRITDYRFSFNTLQSYTHYRLVFPTADMRPVLSGNYLLKVFVGNNPDNPVLTRIFRVLEPLVDIDAVIRRATIVSDRDSRQEIDFRILHPTYRIDDVYNSLKVVITQNDRMDNAITGLKPLFVKDRELSYEYNRENVFDGGNEFRFFDIRTIRYQTERVASISYDTLNKVTLLPDLSRGETPYSIQEDINGKYLIRIREKNDSDTEADYIMVYFTLPYDYPLKDGNVYIYGQLSDWTFREECKMKYDMDERAYRGALYLKQGYYNYEYVYVTDGTGKADETFFEGNHFETGNEYCIYVYNKPMGSRHDQLVGFKRYNSKSFY
jgi:hypothetical protein